MVHGKRTFYGEEYFMSERIIYKWKNVSQVEELFTPRVGLLHDEECNSKTKEN